ncbi:metallophosphoesterase [Anaerolineales bacterium HSG25]|nr:metallophosphoesterase [Anaerolineales bacterium HSG25]
MNLHNVIVNRQKFIAMGATAIAGGIVAASSYFYVNNESQSLVVEQIQIPLKGLGSALEGFKIVQLSDFHLRPFTQIDLIQEAVRISNSLKPDLVVLTGDYVWYEVEAIFDLTLTLAALQAKHGVYSTMGNHDLWTDVGIVRQGFDEVGLPILDNQGLVITEGKDSLYIAGLDDGWSGKPDLRTAMSDWQEGMPVVLLMHEPDLADKYSLDGRIGLQLSGHTHGGQIRFPGIGAVILPYLGWKYDMGLYQVRDMWLYTNRGIGVTNEPVRYNCPPEITEFILVGA